MDERQLTMVALEEEQSKFVREMICHKNNWCSLQCFLKHEVHLKTPGQACLIKSFKALTI